MTTTFRTTTDKYGTKNAVLVKQSDGSYATTDGRFIVTPTTMGDGVTGWAGGRGWSNGHRAWWVEDTTGRASLSRHGKHRAICDRLYEVRRLVAWAVEQENAQ